ncbi:MAG: cupin domain-containing protein [Lentisphaerae bacterium]|nr:cupin domain-containing protein [Lentisphaerota bacterium]
MKKLRLTDLACGEVDHILEGVIPGKYLSQGGMSFKKPGHRSHDVGCTCPSCDGNGRHVHTDDCEVFILLQGKARMEIDGDVHDMVTGDVVVCEPGEDHHIVSDENDPCVNLFLHASDSRHKDQHPA